MHHGPWAHGHIVCGCCGPTSHGRPLTIDREFEYFVWRFSLLDGTLWIAPPKNGLDFLGLTGYFTSNLGLARTEQAQNEDSMKR